jgi:hypothetical protein
MIILGRDDHVRDHLITLAVPADIERGLGDFGAFWLVLAGFRGEMIIFATHTPPAGFEREESQAPW